MVRELERRLERTFDVHLGIIKRVPAAAGLGGGSSDAAAALTAVERLFGLDLPVRLRYEVAGAVGSDVPFFLWPGPQLAMGRGTVLKEIELPEPLNVVIALPGLALPTADVYGWFERACDEPEPKAFVARTQRLVAGLGAARRPRDLAALVENDLEPPVVGRHPADRRARAAAARRRRLRRRDERQRLERLRAVRERGARPAGVRRARAHGGRLCDRPAARRRADPRPAPGRRGGVGGLASRARHPAPAAGSPPGSAPVK